jgi:hypothetical protein
VVILRHMALEHRGKAQRLARGGERGREPSFLMSPAFHQLLALAAAGAAITQVLLERLQ